MTYENQPQGRPATPAWRSGLALYPEFENEVLSALEEQIALNAAPNPYWSEVIGELTPLAEIPIPTA